MAKKPIKKIVRSYVTKARVMTSAVISRDSSANVSPNTTYACTCDCVAGGWWIGNKAMGMYIHEDDVFKADVINMGRS